MAKKSAPAETKDVEETPPEQRSRVETLRREIDRLFDMIHPSDWRLPVVGSSGLEVRPPRWADWQVAPAINLVEKEDAYQITAELAGMSEDDVDVKVSNGVLTVRGEKSEEKEEEEGDYHISERRFGRFQRSFQVPEGVDTNRIDAQMANGVLTVTLPKTAEAKKSEKKIKVKKA